MWVNTLAASESVQVSFQVRLIAETRRVTWRVRIYPVPMVRYCIAVHLPITAEEYMVLKDDPDYVNFQLGVVGARELSRVIEGPDCDGFLTQTIVNRPNVAVPRLLRPLLRGKPIEFRDVRRWQDGTHNTVPFSVELEVSNNISDRVKQKATITVGNVLVNEKGELLDDESESTSSSKDNKESEKPVLDPTVHGVLRIAERKYLGAVGPKTCQILCTGEVTVRAGPLSSAAEALTVKNMRNAYGRFPEIVAQWKKELEAERIAGSKAATPSKGVTDSTTASAGTTDSTTASSTSESKRIVSQSSTDSSSSVDDVKASGALVRTWRLLVPLKARKGVRRVKDLVITLRWKAVGRRVVRHPGKKKDVVLVPDDDYL